ncbi:hypothetical protein HK102_013728 [Quaeritorhiza haematococci]|nr:hypothetical protein HK102_013728 [Quaeritorhiza haematococci]
MIERLLAISALWLLLAASFVTAGGGGGGGGGPPPPSFDRRENCDAAVNSPAYDMLLGYDIEGFDIGPISGISACECASRCNANPQCFFFGYDEVWTDCWLKTGWLQPDIQQFTWALSQQHPVPGDIFGFDVGGGYSEFAPSENPAIVTTTATASAVRPALSLTAVNVPVAFPVARGARTVRRVNNAMAFCCRVDNAGTAAQLELSTTTVNVPVASPVARGARTVRHVNSAMAFYCRMDNAGTAAQLELSTTTVNVPVAFPAARGARTVRRVNNAMAFYCRVDNAGTAAQPPLSTTTVNVPVAFPVVRGARTVRASSAEAAVVVTGLSDTLVDILSVNARFSECRDVPHQPRFRGRDPPRTIRNVGDHAFTATCDSQACLDLFAQITPGKIINLPPTCGSHFTKIVTIQRTQAQTNVFAITYNFEFSTGVTTTEPVTFEAHYGNVPNLLTLIGVTGGDGTAVAKRDLERRRLFSSFSEWLEKISSVSVDASKTFEMRQSFEQVLFDARGQCNRNGQILSSELEVSISGSAFARGTFGVFVAGHLAPTPRIDQAYVYFNADTGARLELDMYANVHYQKREVNRLLTLPLTPFQIPGIGSVGPLLEIDVGYEAEFSMHGAFKAAVNVNIPPIRVAYGERNTDPNVSPAPAGTNEHATGSAVDNVVRPSLQVDFQAGGSVQVFVIPKATLDIDLLEGVLDAQVGLSAQAGLRGSLRADASAGTGQAGTASACLGLDATANVNLFAQGTAFWTQTATAAVSLYNLAGVQLFERCFTKTPDEDSPADGNPPNGSTGGGSVLQPPGGNDGSTATFRRSRRDIRGGLRTRLISRVNMGLQKRSEPLFQITADLCPAEGSSGQDLDDQSCPLPPQKRELDDGKDSSSLRTFVLVRYQLNEKLLTEVIHFQNAGIFNMSYGGNQTKFPNLERRALTIPRGHRFAHQEFLQDILRLAPKRPEAGAWPQLDRVPDTVNFRGRDMQRTLHHIVPIARIGELFRKIVFKNVGGTERQNEIWTMQCPTLLDNLNRLIISNKLSPNSDNAGAKFQAFIEALNLDTANIDDFMAARLPAGSEIRKISEDLDLIASWLPFNLFVGPTGSFRSDDPAKPANQQGRGGFEVKARCLFRCDRRIGGRMWALLNSLDRFLSGQQAADDALMEKFCKSLTDLTQVSAPAIKALPYDESMWEKDHGGDPTKVRIRTCAPDAVVENL